MAKKTGLPSYEDLYQEYNNPKSVQMPQPSVINIPEKANQDIDKYRAEYGEATVGEMTGDITKSLGSGVTRGLGTMFRGGGELLAGGLNKVSDVMGGDPNLFRAIDPLEPATDSIKDSRTVYGKKAMDRSMPAGDITKPETWSMGEAPNAYGYAQHLAEGTGQFLPMLAGGTALKGASTGAQMLYGGVTGGLQGIGAGASEQGEWVNRQSHEELMNNSNFYKELIGRGVNESEARLSTLRQAELGGSIGQGIMAALPGALEQAVVGMIFKGKKLPISNKFLGAGVGAAGGATMEGLQEAGEGVAGRYGANVMTGGNQDLTEGTFAEATLGALPGGAMGGVGGFIGTQGKGPTDDKGEPTPDISMPALGRALDYGERKALGADRMVEGYVIPPKGQGPNDLGGTVDHTRDPQTIEGEISYEQLSYQINDAYRNGQIDDDTYQNATTVLTALTHERDSTGTISYQDFMDRMEQQRKQANKATPKGPFPEPDTEIGTNDRGETVYEDETGKRYLKGVDGAKGNNRFYEMDGFRGNRFELAKEVNQDGQNRGNIQENEVTGKPETITGSGFETQRTESQADQAGQPKQGKPAEYDLNVRQKEKLQQYRGQSKAEEFSVDEEVDYNAFGKNLKGKVVGIDGDKVRIENQSGKIITRKVGALTKRTAEYRGTEDKNYWEADKIANEVGFDLDEQIGRLLNIERDRLTEQGFDKDDKYYDHLISNVLQGVVDGYNGNIQSKDAYHKWGQDLTENVGYAKNKAEREQLEVQEKKKQGEASQAEQAQATDQVEPAFTDKTTIPNIDDVIANPGYFRKQKNIAVRDEQMSPDEYLDLISKGFNSTRDSIESGADQKTVDEYAEAMRRGDKFPMLSIDRAGGEFKQEGRHRALAAKKAGIKQVPVRFREDAIKKEQAQKSDQINKHLDNKQSEETEKTKAQETQKESTEQSTTKYDDQKVKDIIADTNNAEPKLTIERYTTGKTERIKISGDTKAVKDEIRVLGARWNRTYKVWTMPASKEAEARKALSKYLGEEQQNDDDNGVRSYIENGIKVTQKVSLVPGGTSTFETPQQMFDKGNYDYLTKDELSQFDKELIEQYQQKDQANTFTKKHDDGDVKVTWEFSLTPEQYEKKHGSHGAYLSIIMKGGGVEADDGALDITQLYTGSMTESAINEFVSNIATHYVKKPKPKKPAKSKERLQAENQFEKDLAEMGDFLLNLNSMKVVPDSQRESFTRLLTNLMGSAFKLGYVKFKDNAKFIVDTITNKFGKEAAENFDLQSMQGSYISMSSGRKDSTPMAEVVTTTMEDIAKTDYTKIEEVQTEETENVTDNRIPANGERTLGEVSTGNVEGAQGNERTGARNTKGSKKGKRPSNRADEQGNQTGRGRGDDTATTDPVDTREPRDHVNQPTTNFTITDEVELGSGGAATKYKDNVAAIQTLKTLEKENRLATSEEQKILARYVGWGGLANAFKNGVTGDIAKGWEGKVKELESLLTKPELEAARSSTRNAHYTSKDVVDFMWKAVNRLGYGGGNVLEPSMGTGNFLGLMPKGTEAYTTGIELDSLTSRIAAKLYPESNVINMDFGDVPLPNNRYDLAIGNPPFGKNQMVMRHSPQYNKKSIHNQFFLATLDAVRPNGVMAMVVSRYLLDAKNSSTREMLANKAELLGAIRMPGAAFKQNAGTEVVADIIFLRKRAETETVSKEDNAWVSVNTTPDPLDGEPMTINQYFIDNPQMVVGKLDRSGTMQHGHDIDVSFDGDFAKELNKKLELLPEVSPLRDKYWLDNAKEFHAAFAEAVNLEANNAEVGDMFNSDDIVSKVVYTEDADGGSMLKTIPLNPETPWGDSFKIGSDGLWYEMIPKLDKDGNKVKQGNRNVYVRKVYKSVDDVSPRRRLGNAGFEKLKNLLELRDLTKQQISLEANNDPDMEKNRKQLSQAYDRFVKKYGYITEPKNAKTIADMPDEALLMSLEGNFRPAVTKDKAKRTGIDERPAQADKSDIFTKPVVIPPEIANSAATLGDAVAIAMADTGKLNIPRVAELLSKDEETVTDELLNKGMAYIDPEQNGKIVDKNEYLSGNVKRKLNAAKRANLTNNIEALEKIQPEPWTSDKINPVLGGTWIPERVYSDFVSHLTNEKGSVRFFPLTNSFDVRGVDSGARSTSTWGTKDYPAPKLLSAILNDSKIVVSYTDKDGRTIILEDRTQSAKDKAQEIKEEFEGWVFKDQARRTELTELFNDKFNVRVNRQHDGSHMKYPGKVPDEIIKMRRGQNNAIWRGIVEQTVLYDHAVGAGKTFVGIARAMERKRMGLANKPLIVVPNHIVSAWGRDVYKLYPGAKALIPNVKDLDRKNRRRFFARMATGDWDVIVIPHSFMNFLSLSSETQIVYLREEIKLAEAGLKEAEQIAEEGNDSWRKPLSVKQAENLLERLEKRLKALLDGDNSADKLLTFEQIGIDDLTIDESHEFKNLQYTSSLSNVKGMGTATGSQKAMDLYFKTKYLHSQNNGISFLTGTPISNSAVEMYTIMRYLAPDLLSEMGLEHFDAFRSQFVSVDSAYEPTDSGSGLKRVDRLGREWSNMRALMDSYYSFADVVTNDDIKDWFREDNKGQEYPLPKVKGGNRQAISVEPTPSQAEAIEEIVNGFENLAGIDDYMERNAERLRLMDRARKISIHKKALDPNATDEPGGKLDVVADNVMRVYKKWNKDKGTQLIFLDRSIPKSAGDNTVIKEFDKLKTEQTKAAQEGNEDAYKKASDKLAKYDEQEIEAMRLAQNGGWNAYQYIKDNLVKQGIPKNEIAFIHSYNTPAQKQELFNAVNDGDIRVLLGSSPRMGAGTNVQERLVALHHVDATWKPSDIEQREGRIIRQGNALYFKYPDFEVEINAYVTERTVDAKLWSLNSTKLSMINAIRHYEGQFEMSFDDNDSVSMSEIAAIASGDPLLLRRFELEGDIAVLMRKRKAWRRRVQAAEDSYANAKRTLDNADSDLKRAKQYDQSRQDIVDNYEKDVRTITIDGETKTDKSEAKFLIESNKEKGKRFDVNGEVVSKTKALELIEKEFGDFDKFKVEFNGKTYVKRSQYVEALADLKGVEAGTYYGAPIEIDKVGRNVEVSIVIDDGTPNKAAISYSEYVKSNESEVYSSALRSALRKAIDDSHSSFYNKEDNYKRAIAQAKKDIGTLEESTKETFKNADELESLQNELTDVESQLASQAGEKTNTANDAKYSTGDKVKGQTAEQLEQSLVDKFGKLHRNINIVQSQDQLPKHLQSKGKVIKGVFDDETGMIWMVADNIPAGHEINVFNHETGVHAALAKESFFKDVLERINQLKDKGIVKAAYEHAKAQGVPNKHLLEETLAYLVESNPDIPLVKRLIAKVKAWLFKTFGIGKNKLNDADLIELAKSAAKSYNKKGSNARTGIGNLKDLGSRDAMMAMVRLAFGGKSLSDKEMMDVFNGVADDLNQILGADAFVYPHIESKYLEDIVEQIDTGFEIGVMDVEGDANLQAGWVITTPNGKPAYVTLNNDNTVELNASQLKAGSKGSAVYTAISNFAINNNFVFMGDRAGLSEEAKFRRTENMLNSALKYGTTSHLRPHQKQELDWTDGDHDSNIAHLLNKAYTNIIRHFPEIKDVEYDFKNKQFVDRTDGQPVTQDNFEELATSRGARKAQAGSATLKRTALIGTLLHKQGEAIRGSRGDREAILAKYVRQLSQSLDAPLHNIFYSSGGAPTMGKTAEESLLGKINPNRKKTWKEQWDKARKNLGDKIRQGLVDRYHALHELDKKAYGADVVKENTNLSSWVLAKMSSASEGVLHAILDYGRIKMDKDGAIDMLGEKDAKGLIEVLQQLGSSEEINRFMGWIAANRAERLMSEGRENLFTPEEIAAGKRLNRGKEKLYGKVYKEFNQFQRDILTIAEQSGAIDKRLAEQFSNEFYVPFYRLLPEEEVSSHPLGSNKLSKQKAYEKLKGGEEPIGDLLENTLLNMNNLISVSLRNKAAAQAMKNGVRAGVMEKTRESQRDKKQSTWVLENGEKVWYNIDDPLVYNALMSLSDLGMNQGLMKVMRDFKRLFTTFTTASPQFIIANFMRDSIQAAALGKKGVGSSLKGAMDFSDKNKNKHRMIASGGAFSFGHIFGDDPDMIKKSIDREFSAAGLIDNPKNVWNVIKLGWQKYQAVSNRAENANRAAIYEQALAEGKSHLEAAYLSRDLLDFSSRGDWAAIRVLTDIVPFLNARIQGLDVLYRKGFKPSYKTIMGDATLSEKQAAKRFGTIMATVALASIALYLMYRDDEDFKRREDWDRDTYWWFKIGDNAFRIPKPFEIGVIGTMSERLVEQMADDKVHGKVFAERLGHALFDTFSFNPTPQMVRPLLDVYSNKDSFTKRPIESMGMRRLSPSQRVRSNTTSFAKGTSGVLEGVFGPDSMLSPSAVQVDYLIQNYLGWLGASINGTLDTLVNWNDKPEKKWFEYQPMRRFYQQLPTQYSRYTTQFYDNMQEINRVYADIRDYQSIGRYDEALKLAKEHGSKLSLRKWMNRTQREIIQLNKQDTKIRNSNLSPEIKRRRLDIIKLKKDRLTALAAKYYDQRAK